MPQVYAGSVAYPSETPHPVLTIGNFDGLHHGHRHLISALVTKARALGAPAAVYTFDPPPRVVLSPDAHAPRIQSWPDKVRILGELGVDQVVVERFTRAFAQHPPSWFLDEVIGKRIQPSSVVVGYDFRFGRNRGGDVETLRAAFPDLSVTQVEALQIDGETVSSSRIRTLGSEGNVTEAAGLLGCPHRIRGTVIAGDSRGRTIGFPTANLQTDARLTPARGVYAVRARAEQGSWHPAVANLGTRPTFDGSGFLIEVHLLDFSGDLYGAELEVDFIKRLRGEHTFDGPDALIAQINRDVDAARGILHS
jgi:riboflavin kinase / FMN adenylyltransferase